MTACEYSKSLILILDNSLPLKHPFFSFALVADMAEYTRVPLLIL